MPKKKKTKEPKLREAKVVETPDTELGDETFVDDDSMLLGLDGEAVHDDMEEVSEEEKAEKAEQEADKAMFSNEELVNALFEWFDSEIDETDSIALAISTAKEYEISKDNALVALDLLAKLLTIKKVSLQDVYDTIKKK